jgi:hypothetical protein
MKYCLLKTEGTSMLYRFRSYVLYLVFIASQVFVSGSFANLYQTPQTGLDQYGNAVCVWIAYNTDQTRTIQASYYRTGGSWSSVATLSPSGQFSSQPVLSIDSNNNVVAVWSAIDPTLQINCLYASVLTTASAGAWTTPVQISDSTNYVLIDSYRIAMNSNKNVIVCWSAYTPTFSSSSIYTASFKIGGSWSSVTKLSN